MTRDAFEGVEFARADVTLTAGERPGYLLAQISTAGVALISGTSGSSTGPEIQVGASGYQD